MIFYTGDSSFSVCILHEDLKYLHIFQTVAAGQFCEAYGLSGLPDWVVLSSPITPCTSTDEKTGKSRQYQTLDYAALWLNTDTLRPDGIGKSYTLAYLK